jgi:hypothetical protein
MRMTIKAIIRWQGEAPLAYYPGGRFLFHPEGFSRSAGLELNR